MCRSVTALFACIIYVFHYSNVVVALSREKIGCYTDRKYSGSLGDGGVLVRIFPSEDLTPYVSCIIVFNFAVF